MKVRLKLYRGYANEQEIILSGHVFSKNAPDRFNLEGRKLRHAYAVLRMFTIKTLGNVSVNLQFGDLISSTKTMEDGYFRFALPYSESLKSGWHSFTVSAEINGTYVEEKGEFIKPYPGEYGLISDIDDTFLVSHSSNFFLKLYVLLTRNVNKRKIFEGVVQHYRMLSVAGRTEKNKHNAFFYVSSSEWNLYNFIDRFAQLHDLPKAVLKLKRIKTGLGDFLFTGGGSHDHKFYKIKHLLEFYPELKFVLLGDDSQKDPYIYERIVKMFPAGIEAVYIRCTKSSRKSKVTQVLENILSMDVKVCYFKDSSEAMAHSKEIGIISGEEHLKDKI
ncbi:App1 family protein [Pricia sp. S334]|uniref:App1 family protein n=1 Tax=Pricia mediterranea TaxID=3076079 RepID=A0ABU3L3V2_9FLAO|nr:App1 family protein [Pricia sp. S334]MDT7827772.1 App1 family protein [Pricia sp. S334]